MLFPRRGSALRGHEVALGVALEAGRPARSAAALDQWEARRASV